MPALPVVTTSHLPQHRNTHPDRAAAAALAALAYELFARYVEDQVRLRTGTVIVIAGSRGLAQSRWHGGTGGNGAGQRESRVGPLGPLSLTLRCAYVVSALQVRTCNACVCR
jgi:hypothetical protein